MMWVAPLLVTAAEEQSAGRTGLKGHRLSGRRRGGRGAERRGADWRAGSGAAASADSGARWLIKGLTSGRYLYKNGDAIEGHLDFFSLFELRRSTDGSYLMKDHSGGWLGLRTQQAGPPLLATVKPMTAPPPPSPPPMTRDEATQILKAAALESPERKAEIRAEELRAAEAFAAVAATAAEAEALRFYFDEQPNGAYALRLASGQYVYQSHHDAGYRLAALDAMPVDRSSSGSSIFKRSWWWKQGKQASGARPFNDSALFELKRVVAPTKKGLAAARGKTTGRSPKSFMRKVRRSAIRVGTRDVVIATYHNIGMLDWATLFWGWLSTSGIDRFILLELDGVTCEAAQNLNCSLQFECATSQDMMLPEEYTNIKKAGALQEWGTDASSAYFKFLRWKLRLTELALVQGVDVIMIDVDVLVLSPNFVVALVNTTTDLVISSDARKGIYDDNLHCPCSHPQYQQYSADWVCAGLFYMRSTQASIWFMREVQHLMDEFTITDQDAIQAMLTGHTQVAVPQMRPDRNATGHRGPSRPSNEWLKPLWLEGLAAHQNIKNQQGILPLNTPMKEGMWQKCKAKQAAKQFTWQMLPLERFGNGATLVNDWETVFGKSATGRAGDAAGNYLSIHANCWTKNWLTERDTSRSFLFDQRVKAAPRARYSRPLGQPRDY